MYVNISKNVNNKVDSYPPLCHSRGSGNLSSPICRGTMNCAPCGFDESNPYNTLLIPGRHKVCPYLYLTTLFFFFIFLFFLHYPLYAIRCTLHASSAIRYLAANLILYEVPLIDLNLLQMVHQLMDMLLFGF